MNWSLHNSRIRLEKESDTAMDLQYTDRMTGEEYNDLRMCVGWSPITEGQAKRGLEHTTFLVATEAMMKLFLSYRV